MLAFTTGPLLRVRRTVSIYTIRSRWNQDRMGDGAASYMTLTGNELHDDVEVHAFRLKAVDTDAGWCRSSEQAGRCELGAALAPRAFRRARG